MPIIERLATLLADHFILLDHPPTEALLFPGPKDGRNAIHPRPLRRHAANWKVRDWSRLASMRPATASPPIAIAGGLNVKTLSTYMGHATITITLDRYGRLLPRQ